MSRNSKVLGDFIAYCDVNPSLRFWQALRNWSDYNFIIVTDDKDSLKGDWKDTFYWEGKNE